MLAAGTRLGAYEIAAPLGAGGMGEVYRARDTRLGREVAIKALPAGFATGPDRLARFEREARLLASLNHPNIAAIYGLEDAAGAPYLVLELVPGESLAGRLARGPLEVREAIKVATQIAAAIEAAHERGIIHRDLKPGNVMLTPSGAVKVLDFGLAKSDPESSEALDLSRSPTVMGAESVLGVILGTAAYMSPEQARGKPVDRRTDVWAFGCVLYECLTGRPAFSGDTVSDLIARILERHPDWSALGASVPSQVREILRRCLQKDMEARPRDIRDVRLELLEVAAGRGRGESGREKSIAVLPFENQSGADDEYFADGVTDEILNALSHLEGLRVAARTSCFAFKGRREDLRAIGEKLDVTTILEGTVRRSGPRLRITVQLVNASDGYQLWSERYDREMTDVFEVQDEIAKAIATRLRGAMRDETEQSRARGGTKNLEAYELLLRGRALQGKRGRFLVPAAACFERAIALDPNYAEAMAWLAESYRLIGTFGQSSPAEVMPKVQALAERALSIDPDLPEALASLAAAEEIYKRNFAQSDVLYDRALELDPRHSRARAQRALWRIVRGGMPPSVALSEGELAVKDDPLNAWVGAMNSFIIGIVGKHTDSLAEAERSYALDHDSFFAHWNLMRAYAWAGQCERAIHEAPALFDASGRHQWGLGLLAWTYGQAGRKELSQAVFDELMGRSHHEFVSPSWLAIAAGAAGLPDVAMTWAEKAVTERDPHVLWAPTLPFWDSIRQHPRFDEVMGGIWE